MNKAPRNTIEFAADRGLERLLFPCDVQSFLQHYWPERPFAVHGPVERFCDVLDACAMPGLMQDPHRLRELIGAYRVEVYDESPHAPTRSTSVEEAWQLYWDQQASVRLRAIHLLRPVLADWMKKIAEGLNAPVPSGYVNLFMSRAGTRGVPHCDSHEVILIQIAGRKRWRLAQLDALSRPDRGVILGGNADVVRRFGLQPEQIPPEMPTHSETVELEPGSVLFLPRGTFHECRTEEDSAHISISLETLTRADLIGRWIDRRLSEKPEWRRLALGLRAEPSRSRADAADALLHQFEAWLRREAPEKAQAGLVGQALRASMERDVVLYEPIASARLLVDGQDEKLAYLDGPNGPSRLRLNASQVPLMRWTARQTVPFRLETATAHSSELSGAEARAILDVLCQRGVLAKTHG